MIVTPNTQPATDIALAEIRRNPISGAERVVLTEIKRVLLVCKACGTRTCKIDYWLKEGEKHFNCIPQTPCCKKCPQWMCKPCCGGGCDCGTSCCVPVTDIIIGDPPPHCTPVTDIIVGDKSETITPSTKGLI